MKIKFCILHAPQTKSSNNDILFSFLFTTNKVFVYVVYVRVYVRVGDVPLDMRGRCSAGQRVLAAIVIRLQFLFLYVCVYTCVCMCVYIRVCVCVCVCVSVCVSV